MKAKRLSLRRFTYRSLLPAVIILGVFLPFLFIRTAFLALEAGTTICPSISCLGWRIRPLLFKGNDTSLELVKELRRLLLDAEERGEPMDPKLIEAAPESIDHLFAEMTAAASSYQNVDIQTFVLKTKAMLLKMDRKVKLSRLQALRYCHLASLGIPKSTHCLALRLADEYLVNSIARSPLPRPEYSSRLTNASYIHIAILTDNILAASVAVSSTVGSSAMTEKLVFHIITDKKTYTSMHAWFALNPIFPAIVEVKGLHQFDWPSPVNATILRTVGEIHQGFLLHWKYNEDYRGVEARNPSSFSLLNHLRIHLPELFPKLERVILLDDDVIVQRDLTPLWDLNLSDNIIGAVTLDANRDDHCMFRNFSYYFNFSNPSSPLVSRGLLKDDCTWLSGMNIFDLKAWRMTNITQTYQQLLKLNRESEFLLWRLGWLPPALIAFHGNVQPIESSWHVSELGRTILDQQILESAAVLHFSGPRKPWLEIGFPELRQMWRSHLNQSDVFLKSCRVVQ